MFSTDTDRMATADTDTEDAGSKEMETQQQMMAASSEEALRCSQGRG